MYLQPHNREGAALLTSSPLWQDIKRCLKARKTAAPLPSDSPSTAAHTAFLREGWEQVIETIEMLSTDLPPGQPKDPFDRPATDPRD